MSQFFGIELRDPQTQKLSGARYINLDQITRVDYVNPDGARLQGEAEVWLSDGFTFRVDGLLAEQLSLALLRNLENAEHDDAPRVPVPR